MQLDNKTEMDASWIMIELNIEIVNIINFPVRRAMFYAGRLVYWRSPSLSDFCLDFSMPTWKTNKLRQWTSTITLTIVQRSGSLRLPFKIEQISNLIYAIAQYQFIKVEIEHGN